MSVVEKSIGELLVDNGQISAEELRLAEREAKSTGEPLSVILSRLGLAYEHHFKNALELKYGVTYVSLVRTEVQPEILKKVPEAKLREHMMVPVNEKGSRITVVMVNPEHTSGLSALKDYFADRQFTPVVCTEDDFTLFMSNQYRTHLEAAAEAKETNGAKEETAVEKPAEQAPAAETKQEEIKLSPLAAFLAKGKEMLDKAEAESEAAAGSIVEEPKTQAPKAEAAKQEEPKAEEQPAPKPAAVLKDESAIKVISDTLETKQEFELPTNDETGKFDLNMLQKHIEETRNKAKKPAESTKPEPAAKTEKVEIPSPEKTQEKPEEKPEAKAPEKTEDKPADKAEDKAPEKQEEQPPEKQEEKPAEKQEEKLAEKQEEKPPEKQEEKPAEPEKKVEEAPKPEARKEARPDARDVARELAKELEADGKASRDDEATGEFDALASTTMEKKQAPPETKAELKEEVRAEPKPEPKEELKAELKKESVPQPEKPAAEGTQEKTPEVNELKPNHLDQTGEDFKAVSPSSGGQAGMGECEPVASESIARPSSDSKQSEALEKEGDDAAVIMLCNQILANGIAKGASTIHVEVVDKQVLVHYRIQGQLMIVRKLPKMLMPALTARFRKMGRADLQDKRLPQDGRVKVRMSGKDFNLRLTVVPHTAGGEHILVWIE